MEAQNLFFNLTYVEDLTLDTSLDEGLRANLLMQVAQYGQTPSQLLTTPHPARSSRHEVAISELEGIPASLLAEGVIPQKVLRTKHKTAVAALLFQEDRLLMLDSVGRCSTHTVQSTFDTSTGLPLGITVSEKHTKRTVSGVTVCLCVYIHINLSNYSLFLYILLYFHSSLDSYSNGVVARRSAAIYNSSLFWYGRRMCRCQYSEDKWRKCFTTGNG